MKIAIDHVLLDEQGYPGYWVDMPKSVKEGWLYEFQTRTGGGPGTEEGKILTPKERRAQADANRDSYGGLLELVAAWNLDDEAGEPLPLLKDVKDLDERNRVLGELPIDLILHLSDRLTSSLKVKEKTGDFSSKS